MRMSGRAGRAYHNVVLAAACPTTRVLLQRNRGRWAPCRCADRERTFGPGLVSPAGGVLTRFGWFDSWRTFAYMVSLLVWHGASEAPGGLVLSWPRSHPVRRAAPPGRGHYRRSSAVRGPPDASDPARDDGARHAPPRPAVRVTPKGQQGGDRARVPVPRLHSTLAAASVLGLAWFTLTLAGSGRWSTPSRGRPSGPRSSWPSTWRSSSPRWGGFAGLARWQSRASVRLAVRLPATFDGRRVEPLDLSLTGGRAAGDAAALPPAATQLATGRELWVELHGGLCGSARRASEES